MSKLALSLTKAKGDPLVKRWFEFAENKLKSDAGFAAVTAALDELDDHLRFKSVLVGRELSPADDIVWGALKGELRRFGICGRTTRLCRSSVRQFSRPRNSEEESTRPSLSLVQLRERRRMGSKNFQYNH